MSSSSHSPHLVNNTLREPRTCAVIVVSPIPFVLLCRWTRVLLLQQLLVDAIDLLDPDYVRVPANRRIRLAPVAYAPLPNVEQYTAALTLLSGPMDTARFGHKANNEEHFQALQNLLHPERVVEAANQVGRELTRHVYLHTAQCPGGVF